jgi:peptidoglycan/xylan/chitin deacetylase (PgdA/CDA1 family)
MQSLISLTFDDGLKCPFEKAVPILDRHSLRATFFVIANREPIHENWYGKKWPKIDWSVDDIATLRRLSASGHEIGSHSLTHHIDRMPENPRAEARESKELIETWLGTRITSFSYPYYGKSHSFLATAVADAEYEQARGGDRASYYPVRGAQSYDRFNIDCRTAGANDTVAGWMQGGSWHVLTFHGIGDDEWDGWNAISVERFDEMMKELSRYQDDGAVEVLPFSVAAARLESTSSLEGT